jgi:hypothetical protein
MYIVITNLHVCRDTEKIRNKEIYNTYLFAYLSLMLFECIYMLMTSCPPPPPARQDCWQCWRRASEYFYQNCRVEIILQSKDCRTMAGGHPITHGRRQGVRVRGYPFGENLWNWPWKSAMQKIIFWIDRKNPGFLRKRPSLFQNPGDAPGLCMTTTP